MIKGSVQSRISFGLSALLTQLSELKGNNRANSNHISSKQSTIDGNSSIKHKARYWEVPDFGDFWQMSRSLLL